MTTNKSRVEMNREYEKTWSICRCVFGAPSTRQWGEMDERQVPILSLELYDQYV